LLELKEGELVERLKIKAEILKGELILRNIAASTIGKIYSVYRNNVLSMDMSTSDIISSLLGIKEHNKLTAIISEKLYELINEINERVKNKIEQSGKED